MFFFLFRNNGGGTIVNTNTNFPSNVVRPTPAPTAAPLYTQPAVAFIKNSPIEDFVPEVAGSKAEIEKETKSYFTFFTGTIQDAAGRRYSRDEPDEQISLTVLKYAT